MKSGRPDPDTCTRCGESKPLANFRRRNGSYAAWCAACRRRQAGGNPRLTNPFDTPSQLLHLKYGPLLLRLRRQRDRYGRDFSDAARLQLTLVEEVVKDLEDVLGERFDLQMHPSRN